MARKREGIRIGKGMKIRKNKNDWDRMIDWKIKKVQGIKKVRWSTRKEKKGSI